MPKNLRIAVSLLLLAVLAWRTDWPELARRFAQVNPAIWLGAVGLYALTVAASARRWQLFANALRFGQPLTQFCAWSYVGMFFSLALPTLVGGDVVRALQLSGDSGRKGPALASVLLERVNGLLVLIVTACVGTLVAPATLPLWMTATVWAIAAAALLGLGCVPLLARWRRLPPQRREQLQMFLDLQRSPRIVAEATLLSALVQALAILIVWWLGAGLGLDLPLASCAVLVPLVSLLMLAPVSVNGMGVREAGTVLFLAPLGVDESSALALAFLWFTTGVAVSLAGGVVFLLSDGPKTAQTALPSTS